MNYLDQLFGLKGKVAIVTGGSRGIGQVVAIGLARAGAEVAIFSRSEARDTVNTIQSEGGKAYSILVDVIDEKGIDNAVREVARRSGTIDIIFNKVRKFTAIIGDIIKYAVILFKTAGVPVNGMFRE